MPNNYPPAFANFGESAPVDLDKVLSLRSLVMGRIRGLAEQRGRQLSSLKSPRAHGYCVLHNRNPEVENAEDVYTGETDTYLGVRVSRLGYRAWGMGILVQENVMTQRRYAEHSQSIYQFRWTDAIALGRKKSTGLMAVTDNIVAAHPETNRIIMEPTEAAGFPETTPLDDANIDMLTRQVEEFAEVSLLRAA